MKGGGETTVYVVDDEEQSRESVCALVNSMHHQARAFDSGEAFIEQYNGEPGCLVADYRMTGINGLELQQELSKRGFALPVIIVTAYARTPVTVRAIQQGAVTMLDKPYDDDDLWQAIRTGLALDEQQRQKEQQFADIRARVDSLTNKESQVLNLIVEGKPNKLMASLLDVSLRTIENRRRSVLAKLNVDTVAELVALVLKLGDPAELDANGAKVAD